MKIFILFFLLIKIGFSADSISDPDFAFIYANSSGQRESAYRLTDYFKGSDEVVEFLRRAKTSTITRAGVGVIDNFSARMALMNLGDEAELRLFLKAYEEAGVRKNGGRARFVNLEFRQVWHPKFFIIMADDLYKEGGRARYMEGSFEAYDGPYLVAERLVLIVAISGFFNAETQAWAEKLLHDYPMDAHLYLEAARVFYTQNRAVLEAGDYMKTRPPVGVVMPPARPAGIAKRIDKDTNLIENRKEAVPAVHKPIAAPPPAPPVINKPDRRWWLIIAVIGVIALLIAVAFRRKK